MLADEDNTIARGMVRDAMSKMGQKKTPASGSLVAELYEGGQCPTSTAGLMHLVGHLLDEMLDMHAKLE